jgi:GTP cyclohydrolase II
LAKEVARQLLAFTNPKRVEALEAAGIIVAERIQLRSSRRKPSSVIGRRWDTFGKFAIEFI